MTDILREIDEAMRVEKFNRLWKEHGPVLLVAAAGLILGTAAWSGWTTYKTHQHREATSALLTALESPKPLDALATLTKDDHSSNKALLLMTAAAHSLEAKKLDEAASYYDQVIADKGTSPLFRDLAAVQKVNLSLDLKSDATAETLLKEIDPVANNKNSPWQGQALFTRAIVKAHKGQDIKGALTDLEAITARNKLPGSLRNRAQALIDIYQLKEQS